MELSIDTQFFSIPNKDRLTFKTYMVLTQHIFEVMDLSKCVLISFVENYFCFENYS